MLTATQATLFRRLTLGDPIALGRPPDGRARGPIAATPPMPSLLRLASLIAMDATTAAYQREVNSALAAGADPEDIIGVLESVTGVVGSALVMSAAPRLALVLGYDVEDDLERLAPDAEA